MSEYVERIRATSEKRYIVTLKGCDPRTKPYSSTVTYRPTQMTVVKRDGNLVSIELSGPKLKKDGSEGQVWARETLWRDSERPAWVRSILGGLA